MTSSFDPALPANTRLLELHDQTRGMTDDEYVAWLRTHIAEIPEMADAAIAETEAALASLEALHEDG